MMISISEDPMMRSAVRLTLKAALCLANVLLTGESGVGKAHIARKIYEASSMAARGFRTLFCVPDGSDATELELLFDRLRTLEHACGTVYVRGIDVLGALGQRRLLGYLDERENTMVTHEAGKGCPARLIFSSQIDLRSASASGRFLRQLYIKASVITIEVPPLRERETDIVCLANHFVSFYSHSESKQVRGLSREAEYLLRHLSWEGNIHELKNTINQAVVLADEGEVLSAGILKNVLHQTASA
jgi:DNA-binding NtrC family response regulator